MNILCCLIACSIQSGTVAWDNKAGNPIISSGTATRYNRAEMAATVSCRARAVTRVSSGKGTCDPFPCVAPCWPQWVSLDQCQLLSWCRTRKAHVRFHSSRKGIGFRGSLCWAWSFLQFLLHSVPFPPHLLTASKSIPTYWLGYSPPSTPAVHPSGVEAERLLALASLLAQQAYCWCDFYCPSTSSGAEAQVAPSSGLGS